MVSEVPIVRKQTVEQEEKEHKSKDAAKNGGQFMQTPKSLSR